MHMSKRGNENNIAERKLPLVSLIILTYRNTDQIEDTLQTILSQDYPSKEIIISDDASETFLNTVEQEQIQLQCNERNIPITFVRNQINLGTVGHSNAVAAKCNGEYIKFLPPGDGFSDEKALSRLVAFALKHDTKIITSPSYVCKGSFQNICYEYPSRRNCNSLINNDPEKLFQKIAAKNFISAIGTIYRRDFFEDGGYDCSYRYLDDWPTWLREYRAGRRIPCMNHPTVYYSIGGISSSGGNAFDSNLLRNDLKICYEKEILPYKNRISLFYRWMIRYYYHLLSRKKTIGFYILYSPFCLLDWMKKKIKKNVF